MGYIRQHDTPELGGLCILIWYEVREIHGTEDGWEAIQGTRLAK
jgi:hypothetical protein